MDGGRLVITDPSNDYQDGLSWFHRISDPMVWNMDRLGNIDQIIGNLRSDLLQVDNDPIRHQVEGFCHTLSSESHHVMAEMPLPEFCSIREDDEFYLEWIFDDFRFGFDFFEDESQSGWFIVMGGGDEMFRSGSTFDGDYSGAVRYALDVITGGYDSISSAHSV